jgi:D-alanyl-D-alanine carboxypeptidase/D-alanyl-D-alanine-endopeptidase (penicillin-binding protein 4)
MGIGGVKIADGSGLSSGNRASPREVVGLLDGMLGRPEYAAAFQSSLPLAARQGTLDNRMGGTAAAGRCRAKTGTLDGVSTLSGYCRARQGRRLAFSILMNGVDVYTAHGLQDRMVASIARYAPG